MNLKKFIYAYERHGFIGFLNVLLGKLGFKKRLKTPIDKLIFQLGARIETLSKNKIQSGLYADTYLEISKKWSIHDTSSKILGLYEKEVQDQIYQIQNSNNKKKYLINIGAGEGFHIVGPLKKKLFEFGVAFEIDVTSKKLLIKNMEENNIKQYEIFDKAEINFLENQIFLKNKIEDCLFIIDIEGDEFKILNNDNVKKLRNSILIIEIHEFISSPDILYKKLSEFFNISKFTTESRDLSKIEIVNDFNDYERWIMASEGRQGRMEWLVCLPKKN